MKDETKIWLDYADENLKSAKLLLDSGFFNTCLQNIQQAVEKMLKALFIESAIKFHKTHSISDLTSILAREKISVEIAEDDAELLDSIYLPSKYPLGSALPEFDPDETICRKCLTIAEKVRDSVYSQLNR
jgi:HEPN domain-containing protein